jgi:hypothetical protein
LFLCFFCCVGGGKRGNGASIQVQKAASSKEHNQRRFVHLWPFVSPLVVLCRFLKWPRRKPPHSFIFRVRDRVQHYPFLSTQANCLCVKGQACLFCLSFTCALQTKTPYNFRTHTRSELRRPCVFAARAFFLFFLFRRLRTTATKSRPLAGAGTKLVRGGKWERRDHCTTQPHWIGTKPR